MLKTLLPLLRKGDTLGLTIAMEGEDQYRINVLPKLFTLDGERGPDRLALNQPLTLTGTLAELDSPEFVATLTRFTTSATAARHTIDEAEAAHKSAGARPAAKTPAAGKIVPKTVAAKPAEERLKKALADKPAAPAGAEEATEALI